ncbi:unnamed protein product [Caretta caretta]
MDLTQLAQLCASPCDADALDIGIGSWERTATGPQECMISALKILLPASSLKKICIMEEQKPGEAPTAYLIRKKMLAALTDSLLQTEENGIITSHYQGPELVHSVYAGLNYQTKMTMGAVDIEHLTWNELVAKIKQAGDLLRETGVLKRQISKKTTSEAVQAITFVNKGPHSASCFPNSNPPISHNPGQHGPKETLRNMIWMELVKLGEDMGKYDRQPLSILINALSQVMRRTGLMQAAPPRPTAPIGSVSPMPTPYQNQIPALSSEWRFSRESDDQ